MEKLTTQILTQTIQPRPQQSYKGTFGKVLIIAGSANFGGAAIMAATAAVYTGAGLVSVATDPINFTSLHAHLPEAMVLNLQDVTQVLKLATTVNIVAIGPGLALSDDNTQLLKAIIQQMQSQQTLLLDASALTLIAQAHLNLKNCVAAVIITPHQIEWQRLSGLTVSEQDINNNLLAIHNLLPSKAALVLKGAPSHIYFNNDKTIYENTLGTPAMATGGMGDTLTGIIAGSVAQFSDWQQATLAAVFLHSYIAEQLAEDNYVVLPSMITSQLPHWMRYFSKVH